MRLLLDTNVLIPLVRGRLAERDRTIAALLVSAESHSFVSVATLWEIAIKMRLGKLDMGVALHDLPGLVEANKLTALAINGRHAVADVDPEPATRDPFDRLLLAQCAVEGLLLVTFDRVLSTHHLAWRPV